MPVDPWHVGVAGLPLVFLLVVLLGLRWPGPRAGVAALGLTALLAVTVFGLPILGAATALGRAVALSVDVLYIIWTALALYQIAELTGAIRGIGEAIARLTEDHVLQLLIIGFAFTSFLQGVEGFGVTTRSRSERNRPASTSTTAALIPLPPTSTPMAIRLLAMSDASSVIDISRPRSEVVDADAAVDDE